MLSVFSSRRSARFFLAFVVVCLPFVFYGAAQAWERQANRLSDWLPSSHAGSQELKWFSARFGGDEYLAISWPGCRLDDPRLPAVASKLVEPIAISHGKPEVQLFRQAIDGASVFDSLTSSPVSIKGEKAKRRMQGWLLGVDGETTCVIAKVSRQGEENRHAAIQHVLKTADAVAGLSSKDLIIVGPTYDVVAIDIATKATLPSFTLLSWAVCIVVLLFWLRSLWLTSQVFTVAVLSQHASLALMHYSGQHLDSVLLLVANLTFALAVAGGVHLVNYVAHEAQSRRPGPYALRRGVMAARLPTLLAAGTTCIGMLSLAVSRMPPIQAFGVFAALSVVITAVLVLTLLPCLMTIFPATPRQSVGEGPKGWDWVALFTQRTRWAILLIAIAGLLWGWRGASQLQTTTKLQNLFYYDDPVLQHQRWFEQNIGALAPLEVILYWPKQPATADDEYTRPTEFLTRLTLTDLAGERLARMEGIAASVDASTFLPRLPNPRGSRISQVIARNIFAKQAYKNRAALEDTGFYREVDQANNELYRISLRVPTDVVSRDDNLISNVDAEVRRVTSSVSDPPKVLVCGGVPLIYKTQELLLADLFRSFASAIAMIGLVMICVLRRFVLGLLTLIPNVLPIAILFGAIGWSGYPIEIGTVLTASVALGIAVDDSLHFITHYRRALRKGLAGGHAVAAAYRDCGLAMIQTTSALVLSLSVFSLNGFVPIARFAWVMGGLLTLALLTDLLVLASILLISDTPTDP